jgi:hypothetical protein
VKCKRAIIENLPNYLKSDAARIANIPQLMIKTMTRHHLKRADSKPLLANNTVNENVSHQETEEKSSNIASSTIIVALSLNIKLSHISHKLSGIRLLKGQQAATGTRSNVRVYD